jgi:hypothetical protein
MYHCIGFKDFSDRPSSPTQNSSNVTDLGSHSAALLLHSLCLGRELLLKPAVVALEDFYPLLNLDLP